MNSLIYAIDRVHNVRIIAGSIRFEPIGLKYCIENSGLFDEKGYEGYLTKLPLFKALLSYLET